MSYSAIVGMVAHITKPDLAKPKDPQNVEWMGQTALRYPVGFFSPQAFAVE